MTAGSGPGGLGFDLGRRWRALWATRPGRVLRPVRSLLAWLAGYAVLRAVFFHVAGGQGLLTPSQAIDRRLVVLALVLLVMRITLLVAVPLVVTYQLVMRLVARRAASDHRD
ncbi:MAG TPA: hypothetical protein VH165_32090 [Kofleriaceae bacterium]|nr:hypothetical protein [Kofleriaceae bacterium]